MIHVLFVCLGNICRSPMAEAVFRDLVKKEGLEDTFFIDSVGTGHWHVGKPPHQGTQDILDEHKVDYRGIQARQLEQEDLHRFQYIIAMDHKNEADIKRMAKLAKRLSAEGSERIIARLMDFANDKTYNDVPDPYYVGGFDNVYRLVHDGCSGLLEYIKDKENL